MSNFETISVVNDERGVATLTLNRPEKHNALNALMISELRTAINDISFDNNIRCVVLTGSGKSFCAGGDLNWMKSQSEQDRFGKIKEAKALSSMLRGVNRLNKPVIGRINGQAFGGGLGMMSVCDIVVAVDTCRFALTETKLGLIPATIGPYVLQKLGNGPARQVFMNGKLFNADEAKDLGLVSRVVIADELDSTVEEEVGWFLKCAPGAVSDAKALLLKLSGSTGEAPHDFTAEFLADRWETEEAEEGIRAFFQSSKPSWQTS